MKYGILMHEKDDDVGVAVMDLTAGNEIGAATLEGEAVGSLVVAHNIPLGHKLHCAQFPKINMSSNTGGRLAAP